MAENKAQPSQTNTIQTNNRDCHSGPPTLRVLAAKAQQAGAACLNILVRPNTAGPLLITCICVALAYKNAWRARNSILRRRRARDGKPTDVTSRPVLQRSMSIAVLHGGHLALQRIIDAQEARLDDTMLGRAVADFEKLLSPSDGRMRFRELQSAAGKVEMSGKEDEAVLLLKKAMKKANPHEAYELGMLLVEMLIYKGDYDEALRCSCLYDEEIIDARGALFKALIYSLKGDKKAEENYRSFQDIQGRLHWPDVPKEDTPLYDIVHDFNNFQTIAKKLKKEIENVKERKIARHG